MCYREKPEGFLSYDTIDLKNNKKQFWFVNILSLVLAAACVAAGYFIVPFGELRLFRGGAPSETVVPVFVVLFGLFLYIVLHELTHGAFLYAFTKVKQKFGFIGWAAYCGNSAYCDKQRYLIVALSPFVLWGAAFAVLAAFFHTGIWFWVIWILQTVNISGAAGDFFVFFKVLRLPKDVLVQDTGYKMEIFSRTPRKEDGGAQDGTETEEHGAETEEHGEGEDL